MWSCLMYFFFFQSIQYLCLLQDLNLYYNNIPSLVEVSRLQPLAYIKELDLRLNPVVRKDTDYRLFAVCTLQTLEKLGEILSPSCIPSRFTEVSCLITFGSWAKVCTGRRHLFISQHLWNSVLAGCMTSTFIVYWMTIYDFISYFHL